MGRPFSRRLGSDRWSSEACCKKRGMVDLSGEASGASEIVDDRMVAGDQWRKEMDMGQRPRWVTRLGKR